MAIKTFRAYLGLGGNIGDPATAMRKALQAIDNDPRSKVQRVSSLYRTAPWGKIDQPDFLNAVAEIETARSPRQLLDLGLDIEHRLDRVRAERWGPRPIDIDVLWYDGQQIVEDSLHIPHPRMPERAFVIFPLAEIAADLMISGRTAKDRAREFATEGVSIHLPADAWWQKS